MSALSPWSEAIVTGLRSLQRGSFSLFPTDPFLVDTVPDSLLPGAWVQLVGQRLSVSFGLVADFEVCATLAQRLLGYGPETAVTEIEVTDALTEIANIIGGVAKRDLVGIDPSLVTGLPMFFFGRVSVPSTLEHQTLQVDMSNGPAYVVTLVEREVES
ncbi:MAG: chemotaxis protein CheX [Ferrimicrobium sp.]